MHKNTRTRWPARALCVLIGGLAFATLAAACNPGGSPGTGQGGAGAIGEGGFTDGGAAGQEAAAPPLRVISPGVYRLVFPAGIAGNAGSPSAEGLGGSDTAGTVVASTGGAAQNALACSPTASRLLAPELLAPRTAAPGAFPLPGRELGKGRHPLAANCNTLGVTFVDRSSDPAALNLAFFSQAGERGSVLSFGAVDTEAPTPSVAALPDGTFVVAWTDFDDDELGVRLRKLDPAAATQPPAAVANAAQAFSQAAPDLVFDGNQLVVAWVDSSDAVNGPDIRYRTFNTDLTPTSGDLTLAATSAAETDVSLAAFKGSWAAAWRSGSNGQQTIEVQSGTAHWTVGPFLPGGSEDRPALVFLDDTRLAVAFTEGTDPTSSGTANTPRLFAAVLDAAHPGVTLAFPVTPTVSPYSGDNTLAQRQPALERVGNGVVVAWRADAIPGDARGEQLWQRHVTWSATDDSIVIDTTASDRPVISAAAAESGDQRTPALLSPPFLPSGNLVSAWEDYGKTFGAPSGEPDVALQFSRLPADESLLWVSQWGWGNALYGFGQAQLATPGLNTSLASVVVTSPTSPTANAAIATAFTPSGDMWVAYCSDVNEPQQLKKFSAAGLAVSGAPTPDVELTLPLVDGNYICPVALALDNTGNLWLAMIAWHGIVLGFPPDQLLSSGPAVPQVTLGSADFVSINDILFDGAGDLLVSAYSSGIVSRITPSQLLASNPALVAAARLAIPGATGLALDSQGDLWVSDYDRSRVLEIDPSDVIAGGTPTPKVILSGIAGPEDLVFDRSGNLWAASWDGNYIADFAEADLTTSGTKTPLTRLTGNGAFSYPIGLCFSPSPH